MSYPIVYVTYNSFDHPVATLEFRTATVEASSVAEAIRVFTEKWYVNPNTDLNPLPAMYIGHQWSQLIIRDVPYAGSASFTDYLPREYREVYPMEIPPYILEESTKKWMRNVKGLFYPEQCVTIQD